MKTQGLYLHVPFCKQACSYCDFHFSTGLGSMKSVLRAMQEEIKLKSERFTLPLHSVYWGGGTPSLLPDEMLDALMQTIRASFTVLPDAEVTLEANPDDISRERLASWKAAGINRLSIGIQTFHSPSLVQMNRAHTAEMAIQSLETVSDGPIQNFSVDLIYGMPLSDRESWEKDLSTIEAFTIPHLSCYALTVEEKTALDYAIRKGTCKAPDEEESIAQFQLLRTWAIERGFRHYEISNYCQPGCEAVHNRSYWLGYDYLGIGPSAHERQGMTRSANIANNARYVKGIGQKKDWYTTEELTLDETFNEYLLTSLRAFIPIHPEKLRAPWGERHATHLQNAIKRIPEDWITWTATGWIVSEAGMLFADKVASELFLVR